MVIIARRESYIRFENKEKSHGFEKSNDFSGGDDKVFPEYLIAKRER